MQKNIKRKDSLKRVCI